LENLWQAEDLARGLLTEMQLWDAAKRIGLRMTTGELSQMFAELDLNMDGAVHFSEFAAVLRTLHEFDLPCHILPSAHGRAQQDAGESSQDRDLSYCVSGLQDRHTHLGQTNLGWLRLQVDLSDLRTQPWSDGYGSCAALQNKLSEEGDASLIIPHFSPDATSGDSLGQVARGLTAAQVAPAAASAAANAGFALAPASVARPPPLTTSASFTPLKRLRGGKPLGVVTGVCFADGGGGDMVGVGVEGELRGGAGGRGGGAGDAADEVAGRGGDTAFSKLMRREQKGSRHTNLRPVTAGSAVSQISGDSCLSAASSMLRRQEQREVYVFGAGS